MRFNHLDNYTYGNPRAIIIDNYGFLWIGTNDGLLKYDGYRYSRFTPVLSNNNSISGRYVRKLMIDSNDQLWIGTTNGLNRFNYLTNTFTEIDLNDARYVYDIFESSDGTIWVGTRNGLHAIHKDGSVKSYKSLIKSGQSTELSYVRKIHQDSDENIWVGTREHGLLRLNVIDDVLEEHIHSPEIEWIMGINDYTQDELLVSTYTNGIYIFNKRTNSISKYSIEEIEPRIRGTITTKDGSHWISTIDHGVLVLNESKLTRLVSNELDERSLQGNRIFGLYEDSKSNIWIGTRYGISTASLKNKSIENYFVDGTAEGLNYGSVYAIVSNKMGELYFGTHGAGIDKRLNDSKIQNIPLNNISGLDNTPNVSALLFHDDKLWVGSSDGLLVSRDDKYFELIRLQDSASDNVLSLIPLNEETLLVGTTSGLYTYNIINNTIINIPTLVGEAVLQIHIKADAIWLVTRNGLYKLNLEFSLEKHYKTSELEIRNTSSMVHVSNDLIVVGSFEDGIIFFDPINSKALTRLNETNGLSSDVIYSLALDNQKYIWASSQQGISRINIDSLVIDTLNVEDGLQSEEFNLNAMYKDSLGKLYFGGMEGVTAFYPQRLFKELEPPSMVWSRFETVFDGQYAPGLPQNSLVEGELNTNVRFQLSYDDMSLIEFSTDQLLKSDWVRYQTRLSSSGNNADWIGIRNDDRQLNISLLPPGSHQFDVRASLNGQVWSDSLSMEIDIAPPPWQTWWAYLSYMLAISLVIGYFLRLQYQKNQEKMRTQKLIRDSEERLKLALWGSRDELWDWNLISGKIHRSNTWGILSFPKRETDETGKNSIFRNIHPKDLPYVRAALDDHRNGYTSHYEATYRIKDKDGNWIWILDRGKIVEHDAEGNPLRMSGTIRNISEIRDTQEQLDLIAKAFENTSDGVFILDNQFKYQAVNKAYEKITGFKFNEKRHKLFEIQSNHTSAKDVLHKVRQALVLEGAWQGELEDTRASGETYTIELKLDAVRDRLDEITHFVGVFSDITYRKKAEQDLRRMANYDQLTGLPNRSLFQDRLKHAIDLSDRNNKELILLFIDLDNFKIVNDSLGHSIGDKLLTKVAERISACVRSNDTVARLGGDEYTILLEQVEGSFVGTRVADKILDALSRPFRLQGHELVISCSIGIALYPDDGADVETLLRNADTAMYSAKYQNKNNYQFFTDSMNKKANSRLEMEHELRKAIPAGDIKVVYQPKVDLTSGEIIGCEALARWNHPEMGYVSPEDFIALAEETGLIYSLGESVLHQSCQATSNWKREHNYDGRTAVNLSAIQFRQSGLIGTIESILTKYGLSGTDIELELTEGMLVTNPESVNQIMTDLRSKGYHLSIDDFGTGYASMAQLKKFPINTLKIDKTFIDDITNDEQDASLVRAILSLAQNLNLETVAEGVEHEDQLDVLREMGCENIQGYVYSKPISEEEFAQLLDKKLTLNDVIKLNNEKIINFPA